MAQVSAKLELAVCRRVVPEEGEKMAGQAGKTPTNSPLRLGTTPKGWQMR